MKTLHVKPIPIPSGATHGEPPNDVLPKHEFSMGFIAPKGSGKTTALINLIDWYKGYFNKIIIFSPTVKNDEKWDWVKKRPLLAENKVLKNFIRSLRNKNKVNVNGQVVHTEEKHDDLEEYLEDEFSPYIPDEHYLDHYDQDTLEDILTEQQTLIDKLKKLGKTKHIADKILIIFDDLVGSSLFSNHKGNPFKKLNTNHRHYSISMLEVSQAYKELPKTVRTQLSCLIVFEIPNDKEVEVIYEENPMHLKRNDWMEMYDYATKGDHDFLYLNYQKPRAMRMMRNFEEYLYFK